jgi:hypothetical protein
VTKLQRGRRSQCCSPRYILSSPATTRMVPGGARQADVTLYVFLCHMHKILAERESAQGRDQLARVHGHPTNVRRRACPTDARTDASTPTTPRTPCMWCVFLEQEGIAYLHHVRPINRACVLPAATAACTVPRHNTDSLCIIIRSLRTSPRTKRILDPKNGPLVCGSRI